MKPKKKIASKFIFYNLSLDKMCNSWPFYQKLTYKTSKY